MKGNKADNELIEITPRVKEALAEERPVIALESTLIAHGFPYPQNFDLALELRERCQEAGVVPATIAVLGGKIRVGLSEEEIEYIARAGDIHKASLRDLPVLVAKRLDGGTTVASTMQIADLVGIEVFVTGGIGGVHRNAENTFDISADLQALTRYRVTVVCAGAKSVLDLPKTRERLETLGIPVLGYCYDHFPGFYIRNTGLPVDYRVDEPQEVKEIRWTAEVLGNSGGLLVTTPVPEEYELDEGEYNRILERLLRETEREGISGQDITPYLLRRIKEETAGESVSSNIALIENNLRVGIEIVTS